MDSVMHSFNLIPTDTLQCSKQNQYKQQGKFHKCIDLL